MLLLFFILQLINTFSNVAGYKINKNSVALLYTNNKEAEKKSRKYHSLQTPQIT